MHSRWLDRLASAFAGPTLAFMLGGAAASAVVLSSHDADAKASVDSTYGYDRTWNAALRLVRVDLALKVTEKDEQNGYLLFDYRSPENGNKPTAGSIELVRGKQPDEPVHVIVQLPQMPRYHEQVLIDSLTKKMRAEYGEAPRVAPRVPVPDKDAGTDAGS